MASFLVAIILFVIVFSRTVYESAETKPETSASPSPKLASIERDLRFDVIGSAVNRIPDASGNHLLNNDGKLDFTMIELILNAINNRAFGKQRSPAHTDML